jgi:carbonic anhydrase
MDAPTVLNNLKAGNERFVRALENPQYDRSITESRLVEEHAPSAMVLACADARIPIEMIFDQPIGELFVVRIAGNIVTPEVLGSLEFAAGALGVELLLVLGHTQCGAVSAAVNASDQPLPAHLSALVEGIRATTQSCSCVNEAIDLNVHHSVQQIAQRSPVLAELIEQSKLTVIGARYSVESGVVEFFDTAT